jgi:cytochrome c
MSQMKPFDQHHQPSRSVLRYIKRAWPFERLRVATAGCAASLLALTWAILPGTAFAQACPVVMGCPSPSAAGSTLAASEGALAGKRILVFSKTAGFRHDSIPTGIAMFQTLAQANGFTMQASEDANLFNDTALRDFQAIVFLNTSSDILAPAQEAAMERFIRGGGGFVGIHAAADTEWQGSWIWYRGLLGAVFKNHPAQQQATLAVVSNEHAATRDFPMRLSIIEEWYNFSDLSPTNNVILSADESTYTGGIHGECHPIAWFREYDGGRSFYTALGHRKETYALPAFRAHVLGGLKWVLGGRIPAAVAQAKD